MQKLLTCFFFSKDIRKYAIFNDQSLNDTLTNNIISFEQLGSELPRISIDNNSFYPRFKLCIILRLPLLSVLLPLNGRLAHRETKHTQNYLLCSYIEQPVLYRHILLPLCCVMHCILTSVTHKENTSEYKELNMTIYKWNEKKKKKKEKARLSKPDYRAMRNNRKTSNGDFI